jgi:hypothetical protein
MPFACIYVPDFPVEAILRAEPDQPYSKANRRCKPFSWETKRPAALEFCPA